MIHFLPFFPQSFIVFVDFKIFKLRQFVFKFSNDFLPSSARVVYENILVSHILYPLLTANERIKQCRFVFPKLNYFFSVSSSNLSIF